MVISTSFQAIAVSGADAAAQMSRAQCRELLNSAFGYRIHHRDEWGRCEALLYPTTHAAANQNMPLTSGFSMTATDREAQEVANRIWKEQLFECGEFVIYEDEQYRETRRYVIRSKLDESDMMNGVTWRGYLAIEPRFARTYYPNGTNGDWTMPSTFFSDELAKRHIDGTKMLREEDVGQQNLAFWDKQTSLVAKTNIEKRNGEWRASSSYESVDELIAWMKTNNISRQAQFRAMCSQ